MSSEKQHGYRTYTPTPRGTGLRRKDDGDGLTISSPVSSMSIEKKYGCRTYPPRRRGTGLRRKDDGVGLTISSPVSSMSIEKKYGCRTYTPPPERNGTPAKGRWGWANDLVASKLNVDREKIWLQDLYPRSSIIPRETDRNSTTHCGDSCRCFAGRSTGPGSFRLLIESDSLTARRWLNLHRYPFGINGSSRAC